MKSFLLGIGGMLTVLVLAAIIVPQYSDYTDRAITHEILVSIEPLKRDIEKQLLQNKTVVAPEGVLASLSQHVSSLYIYPDGRIQIKGGKIGQIIILTPKLIDTKHVQWQCLGGPNQAMTAACNTD